LQQSDQFAQKKNDSSCFVNHWKSEIRAWFKRKKMKNEEWHFTLRKEILYSRESFTKKIAQTKSRWFSCETFWIWKSFWATLKKILMIEYVEKR
jgi:hypothetical protein